MNPGTEIKREEADQGEGKGVGQPELVAAETVDQAGFQFEVSDDQRSVRIHNPNIPDMDVSIDAQTLDALIWRLRQCRGQMLPEQPAQWPSGRCQVTVTDWYAEPRFGGGTLFHVRDPGLGWLHCVIEPEYETRLAEFLRSNGRPETGSKH